MSGVPLLVAGCGLESLQVEGTYQAEVIGLSMWWSSLYLEEGLGRKWRKTALNMEKGRWENEGGHIASVQGP